MPRWQAETDTTACIAHSELMPHIFFRRCDLRICASLQLKAEVSLCCRPVSVASPVVSVPMWTVLIPLATVRRCDQHLLGIIAAHHGTVTSDYLVSVVDRRNTSAL